ncbi:hypothetical protein D3C86_1074180 [compost metagenome]
MSGTTKKPLYKRWWVWVLAVIVVAGAMGGEKGRTPLGTTPVASEQAAKASELPADEMAFISILAAAQQDARKADNDMQRGGIKAKRDQELCKAINKLSVQDWVGKVTHIGANSDGKGVFSIEIAKDITVKTWNNEFSDMMHKTLLQPGSPLFTTASNLKNGQMVKFSGSFFKGLEGDCVFESSMSLQGKLADPEFIFRFGGVAPL